VVAGIQRGSSDDNLAVFVIFDLSTSTTSSSSCHAAAKTLVVDASVEVAIDCSTIQYSFA